MRFINSYKQLEKICNEIYYNNHGISSYIEDMENIPNGFLYVDEWDNDFKQLKHYRWIRNKIVHDLDCTEENMCKDEDSQWLDNFYSRIMEQTDPLTLYRKATDLQINDYKIQSNREDTYSDTANINSKSKNHFIWIVVSAIVLLFMIFIILMYYVY